MSLAQPPSHYFYRGALLTPSEMGELTEAWKPYRSLGTPDFI